MSWKKKVEMVDSKNFMIIAAVERYFHFRKNFLKKVFFFQKYNDKSLNLR